LRLKITFRPHEDSPAILPVNYNELIQGFIYHYLDEYLAAQLHEEGLKDPESKRSFKFFTFSRLIPLEKPKIEKSQIFFSSPIILIIGSPLKEFIQSMANHLIKAEIIKLGNETFLIESIAVEASPPHRENVLVRALSPITVYSTLTAPNGKKKTYYYSPFEEEFETLIIENLNKKYRALTGEEASFSGSIKPFKVSSRNQRIVLYKGTVIKGWDGVYELSLPPELFYLAFEAGLGSKNSQGFGCIEVWGEENE